LLKCIVRYAVFIVSVLFP
jgi:hypothetical protein